MVEWGFLLDHMQICNESRQVKQINSLDVLILVNVGISLPAAVCCHLLPAVAYWEMHTHQALANDLTPDGGYS